MILVLDDVVDLNSTFQSDSMKILDELDQPNINEKWYSLEEQHPFDNFCNMLNSFYCANRRSSKLKYFFHRF